MKASTRFSAVLAVGAALAGIVTAEVLGPGSKAPELSIKKWYKGGPVAKLEPNKTYVVEFWATWCGPCIQSIPHVTELAKKHKDVTFIGVSIWEDDKGTTIADFVNKMGAKMDYNVAYSGNKDGMAVSWMQAAKQNGIPSAFIVKNGVVQWVGHPMSMDEPLALVTSGKWDLAAARKEFDAEVAQNEARMAAGGKLRQADALYKQGKKEEAAKLLTEVETSYKEMAPQAAQLRLNWLALEDPAACSKRIDEIAAGDKGAGMMLLVNFASQNAANEKTGHLARKAIEIALKWGNDTDVLPLYYGVEVYSALGDVKAAYACATKGLAALPNSPFKENEGLKKHFEAKVAELKAKLNDN